MDVSSLDVLPPDSHVLHGDVIRQVAFVGRVSVADFAVKVLDFQVHPFFVNPLAVVAFEPLITIRTLEPFVQLVNRSQMSLQFCISEKGFAWGTQMTFAVLFLLVHSPPMRAKLKNVGVAAAAFVANQLLLVLFLQMSDFVNFHDFFCHCTGIHTGHTSAL